MTSLWFLLILGCPDKTGDSGDNTSTNVDADNDGFSSDVDCDDNDETVFPGAVAESTDLCLRDQDGDGFGDANASSPYDSGTDCDDADPLTFPGAAENESDSLCQTDADNDGYGSNTPATGVTPGEDGFDSDPTLWLVPTEGAWSFGEAQNIVNTCNFDDEGTGTETETGFSLVRTGDTTFDITFLGSTDSVSCSLTGPEFSCSIPQSNDSIELSDINATLDFRITTTMTGSFSSSNELSSDFNLTVDCVDVSSFLWSCDIASDYLPCSASWTLPGSSNQ